MEQYIYLKSICFLQSSQLKSLLQKDSWQNLALTSGFGNKRVTIIIIIIIIIIVSSITMFWFHIFS